MHRLIEPASNWFHYPLFNKQTVQEIEQQGVRFELGTKFELGELKPAYPRFILYYGSKYLRVNIDDKSQRICTYVRASRIKDKEPNETTIIYKAAYKLMQKYVDKKNKPFVYEFSSSSVKMQNWAVHAKKGKSIFNWERSQTTNTGTLICTITITPQKE